MRQVQRGQIELYKHACQPQKAGKGVQGSGPHAAGELLRFRRVRARRPARLRLCQSLQGGKGALGKAYGGLFCRPRQLRARLFARGRAARSHRGRREHGQFSLFGADTVHRDSHQGGQTLAHGGNERRKKHSRKIKVRHRGRRTHFRTDAPRAGGGARPHRGRDKPRRAGRTGGGR